MISLPRLSAEHCETVSRQTNVREVTRARGRSRGRRGLSNEGGVGYQMIQGEIQGEGPGGDPGGRRGLSKTDKTINNYVVFFVVFTVFDRF